jgi:hypothetical protein
MAGGQGANSGGEIALSIRIWDIGRAGMRDALGHRAIGISTPICASNLLATDIL